MRSLVRCVMVFVVAGLCFSQQAAAYAAGPPVITRMHNEVGPFTEEGLTEDCGFNVQESVSQDVLIRTYPDGTRLAEVVTAHANLTFTANGNTVTFRET